MATFRAFKTSVRSRRQGVYPVMYHHMNGNWPVLQGTLSHLAPSPPDSQAPADRPGICPRLAPVAPVQNLDHSDRHTTNTQRSATTRCVHPIPPTHLQTVKPLQVDQVFAPGLPSYKTLTPSMSASQTLNGPPQRLAFHPMPRPHLQTLKPLHIDQVLVPLQTLNNAFPKNPIVHLIARV